VEQGFAAHVHLFGGQLAALYIYGEGVAELYAELEPLALSQSLESCEHLYGVAPLQILFEVVIVKGYIVEACFVKYASCVLVA
jgi:hypothetical protein